MQKFFLILSVVFSLAAASLGILNREKLIKERFNNIQLEVDRDNAVKKQRSLALEVKESRDKLSLIDSDAQKTAGEISDLRTDAERKASDLAQARAELTQKDSIISQQKADLAAKDDQIAKLGAETSSTNKTDSSKLEEIKRENDELKILTSSQQAKLKSTESQLATLRERESQRRSKMMRSGLEGTILAVNFSWNFVVISLGDRNGVVNNAEMLINRGSQLLGKVRITSVEPSTSIADIVANSVRSGTTVQPGDTVIYRGPGSDGDTTP